VARADSSNEHLHKVRIDLKRLQCACEVLGWWAESQPSMARAAEKTQTKLGVVHDQAVADAWLKSLTVAEPNWKVRSGRYERSIGSPREAKRGWRTAIDEVEHCWDDLQD